MTFLRKVPKINVQQNGLPIMCIPLVVTVLIKKGNIVNTSENTSFCILSKSCSSLLPKAIGYLYS